VRIGEGSLLGRGRRCTLWIQRDIFGNLHRLGGDVREGEIRVPLTVCPNCQKKGHTKENCWGKGGRKEGQGPFQKKKEKNSKKKKKGKDTANVAEESDSDKEDDSISFLNLNYAALIKDNFTQMSMDIERPFISSLLELIKTQG
jgi:hypothetical protein